MAFTRKIVGDLIFNQEEGTITHKRTSENLAKFPVKIAIPIPLLAKSTSVAIDSTGVKESSGHFEIPSELLKHVTSAFLEAYADAPSATDAVVAVELYNVTDSSVIASVSYSGDSGLKKSSDIASALSGLAGKTICGRLRVTTASGTSGATQVLRSIVLVLIIDLTKE